MIVMNSKLVSIVIPARNEAPNIVILLTRIKAVFDVLPEWTLEVLWIDDGSTDHTKQLIQGLQAEYSWLILIALSKNYGHQAALEAGLMHAKGEVIISIDGDCQHPPEMIPQMLQAYIQGAEVVQMIRNNPVKGMKGFFSRAFYKAFSMLTNTYIVEGGADFRLMSYRIIEIIKLIPEREKFLRALLPSLGFKQVQLAYKEGDRHAGTPSYTFKRSFKLARKALFDFSTLPLRVVFYAGLALAVLSFIGGCIHIMVKLLDGGSVTPGFTDIIVSILFLSGCILGSVGIIGRYIQLILDQLRGRPNFIIEEIVKPGQGRK